MKKLLSLILALLLALSLVACTNKDVEETSKPADNEVVEKEDTDKDVETEKEENASEENASEENASEENASEEDTSNETEKEPSSEQKPVKPETENTTVPETNKTVGQALLSSFKKSAKDSSSALSIAEALVANDVIAFAGGAMSVEEGYLTGFDNTEIKGFSEGAMFAPMIGTIPFVGYVFTLAEGTNASDFIKTLEGAANLRWNICTSADEMVTGSSGNKVFFVMCPTSFEDAE